MSDFSRFVEAVTAAMPAIIYTMDAEGTAYRYLSPAIQRLLGYSPEDIVAFGGPAYMLSIMHPEDRERVFRKHAERVELLNRSSAADQDQYTHSDEYRLQHRNGQWRWFRSSGVVFERTADGRVATVLGVAQDITESKQLEERLQFSDRMATVGRLAAGVAHEINTPLTHIFIAQDLAIEGLGQGKSPSEIAASLKSVLTCAERISKIVLELKTFSRCKVDAFVPLDVHAAVESALTMVENTLAHRARVTRAFTPVSRVLADEGRLTQVFLNLLLNAAQAIPQSGRADANEIRVSTGTDAAGRVFVEVADTGQGIAQDHLGAIFDPFFTTKPVGEGTGLGLSISYSIVKSLGGEVTVESRLGQGSCFRVTLPAVLEAKIAAAPTIAAKPASVVQARRGHVLVIDDDQGVAETIADALRDRHSVTVALSAQRALEVYRESPSAFDLVLCDVMMPDMNGIDLLARLTELKPDAGKRFVFMTGATLSNREQDALRDLPNRVLAKPFHLHAVRTLVQTFTPELP